MKVIFLDVDGVFNTSDTEKKSYYIENEEVLVELDEFRILYLKTILDKTGAKIVLASSWVNYFMKEDNKLIPIHPLGKVFSNLLTKYGIEIYDITPKVGDLTKREKQIYAWLSNQDNIESFIIIDDEPSMFNELLDRIIKTSIVEDDEILMNMDDCIGLCEEHIDQAVKMLNNKTKVLK